MLCQKTKSESSEETTVSDGTCHNPRYPFMSVAPYYQEYSLNFKNFSRITLVAGVAQIKCIVTLFFSYQGGLSSPSAPPSDLSKDDSSLDLPPAFWPRLNVESIKSRRFCSSLESTQ